MEEKQKRSGVGIAYKVYDSL